MAKLLAIVEVDESQKVMCQEVGCGHWVYKRIHIVDTGAGIMVMGSTCYAKAHGNVTSYLGSEFVGNGGGRVLTDDEAFLLKHLPKELVSNFQGEAEENRERHLRALEQTRAEMKAQQDRFEASQKILQQHRMTPKPEASLLPKLPWPWMKPHSSLGYFEFGDGEGWCRVMNNEGVHFVMPWPAVDGWDESLPPSVGQPNEQVGGYQVSDVAAAVAFLRKNSKWEKIGIWRDIAEDIQRRKSKNGEADGGKAG